MKPLDDELRAVLSSRADSLPLVSDPVVGIEKRARRMQRNRIAASVAGAALAVSAVAVAVPALTSGSSTDSLPTVATTPTPEASGVASPYALDPADPWPYRGDPQVLENGNLETFAREWAGKQGYGEDAISFTPLYGELYEPAGAATVVYVAQEPTGRAWWGVVQSSESGPEFLLDTPLRAGATALPAALPGDEVARLLVTASPEVGAIQYGPDGASEWVNLTSLAPGIGIGPLEGHPENDRVRVLDREDAVVFDELAPDP